MFLKNIAKKSLSKIQEKMFFLKYPCIKQPNLHLHPKGEFVSDEIRLTNKYYELDLLMYIKNNYNIDRFCDIGANIGNHSSFFEKLGSTGWAFQPSRKNFELLKKNAPSFNLYNIALSDNVGVEKFVTYESSCGNSNLLSNFNNKTQNWGNGIEYEEVKVDMLDKFNIIAPTFIKIDVEGAELKVLNGSKNTLRKYKPNICIELHTDENLINSGFQYTRKDVDTFFEKIGYQKKQSFDSTNHFYEPI